MKLLLVEDDALLGRSLVKGLTECDYLIDWSREGTEGAYLLSSGDYDGAILDWMLPGTDGVEVLRRHRRAGGRTPVLMLTARDATPDIVAGLDAGADDYLVKPFAAEELVARVRALLRRGEEPRELLTFADVVLDVESRKARRGGEELSLSAREADLLELLLRNPRRTVSRDLALDRVWGCSSAATLNVVDRYVSYLRRKLGEPELIRTVRGVGFVLDR